MGKIHITTKINGINSFEFTGLADGLCLSDVSNKLSPLVPTKNCRQNERRFPFSQCKNNCPGGVTDIKKLTLN